MTIPEIGRIAAPTPPVVMLTSNRTRELHDALKRRCLYHWIDHPGSSARSRSCGCGRRRSASALARDVAAAVAGCASWISRSHPVSPRRSTGRTRWRSWAPTPRRADRRRHARRRREGPRGPASSSPPGSPTSSATAMRDGRAIRVARLVAFGRTSAREACPSAPAGSSRSCRRSRRSARRPRAPVLGGTRLARRRAANIDGVRRRLRGVDRDARPEGVVRSSSTCRRRRGAGTDWGDAAARPRGPRRPAAASWSAPATTRSPSDGEAAIRIVASAAEVLREKSFADLTEEERARGRADPPARRSRAERAHAAARARPRRVPRSTFAGRSGARCARRASRSNGPGARVDPSPAARAAARRQRVDGAVLAGAAAVRVRGDGGRPPRGGLRLRHEAHARHADAAHARPRPGAARDRRLVQDWEGGTSIGESLRRCWTGGASGRRCAAPSSCSAPTAWSAATRSCCARRWRGCGGWRTGSCG